MKYKVVIPLARIGQAFAVGDLIEISDKAEAERMIAANIVTPMTEEPAAPRRNRRPETAEAKHIGVEKAVVPGRKRG